MSNLAELPPPTQPSVGSSLWLQQMIDATREPHVAVVNMTPELAKTLLDLNPDNRSIRNTKVVQYAADMAAGRWALNGEPIIVSTDGHLNDGQHRCRACIDANTAIPIAIMFGIERDTRQTVDQGAARTAGDILDMQGIQNPKSAAAIARMAIAFERNDGRTLLNAKNITTAEIRERVYTDPSIGVSATFGHTNGRYSARFAVGSAIGFAHYVLSRINPGDAETYLSRVCRGDGLKMRDPAHTVREKLLSAGRMSRDRKIKVILHGWNFYRRGQKVSRESITSELPFPALI